MLKIIIMFKKWLRECNQGQLLNLSKGKSHLLMQNMNDPTQEIFHVQLGARVHWSGTLNDMDMDKWKEKLVRFRICLTQESE